MDNKLKNPLTFASKEEFLNYLAETDDLTLAYEEMLIDNLVDDLDFTYAEYEAKVISEIILPLRNRSKNDEECCSKDELLSYCNKACKMGFALKSKLSELDKAKFNKEKDNAVASKFSDRNELINRITNLYSELKEEHQTDFSLCAYDRCEALMLRLINVPLTYYANLFKTTDVGDEEINAFLAKRKIDTVPGAVVGNYGNLKLNPIGAHWKDSYETLFYSFYLTLQLNSKKSWRGRF